MRYFILILIIGFFIPTRSNSQEANPVIGCASLEVMFSALDGLPSYFWDFGDATNSELQNPNHIYTQPGVYTVRLFDQQGGNEIGTLIITVLPSIVSDFTADIRTGCAPLTVSFTDQSIIPAALALDATYEWVFGDGSTSQDKNPTHVYTTGGVFSVSLKITTPSFEGCDNTHIEDLYIQVPPLLDTQIFSANRYAVCNPSDPITFSIEADEIDGLNYTWAFGDQNTAVGYGPLIHTYDDPGSYFVSLTVSDAFGCSLTYMDTVSVVVQDGKPKVNRLFPDTVCAGIFNLFEIESTAGSHLWSFSSGVSMINRLVESPEVYIAESGDYTLFLKAGPRGCRLDTTFKVTAVMPNDNFTFSPDTICHTPSLITFIAEDQSLAKYIWSADTSQSAPMIQAEVGHTVYDSFFMHYPPQMRFYYLTVEDARGCRATDTLVNTIFKPDAYFLPLVSRGCAPLNVQFENLSTARKDIISNSWIFGDGQRFDVDSNAAPSHVYENPGEYYVRLIIESEEGCRDTSHAMKIIVGEEIDIDFELDKNEICPGDSVLLSATTIDDRIDAWHFYTDDEQSSHCYTSAELNHVFFTNTGFFDVTLFAEYNGCFSSHTKTQAIEVKGPLAKIDYLIDCAFPYQVLLDDLSQRTDRATWKIGDEEISSQGGEYTHTFSARGDYTIYLIAENTASDCPTSIDSVTVHIRDVQSSFDIEDSYCAGDSVILNAILSEGVDSSCYKGYTWFLPGKRPRTKSVDRIAYIVQGRGEEQFILVTEDINGCTDTLIKTASISNIVADFIISDSIICLQQAVDFTDATNSELSIVDWTWSFGSKEQSPKQVVYPFPDTIGATTNITLQVVDAAGCPSSVTKFIKIYHPFTDITITEDTLLCVGEEVNFTASDYTGGGSFFNFSWNDESGGTSSDSTFITSFNEAGNHSIHLIATEDVSGCQVEYTSNVNVQAYPVSDFEFPQELKCKDQIIFENLSTSNTPIGTIWIPGDGSSPIVADSIANLKFGYDVGTYLITLISTTTHGCTDTISKTLEIIAPQGDFFMSDSIICLGGRINLALIDTADVNDFIWDFGDGVTTENMNPITHIYDQIGTPRSTQVTLTVRAANGCEISTVKPLKLEGVLTNFGFELDTAICFAQFIDSSQSSSQQELIYTWFFGDGGMSNEMNPGHLYGVPGEFLVSQIIQVQDGGSLCIDTFSRPVIFPAIDTLVGMPNAFTPNGDGLNDFFNVVLLGENLSFNNVTVQEFKIFNRWGKLVYNNFDPAQGWNGRVDGQEAAAEVYAYIIALGFKDGGSWSQKGNVTLLRGR